MVVGSVRKHFFALKTSISALGKLAEYLFTLGFKYVCLGKITSDSLESRFGLYRSLSGSNYFISLKNLLDSERKIRSISLLMYSNIDLTLIDQCFDDPEDNENALIDDI